MLGLVRMSVKSLQDSDRRWIFLLELELELGTFAM